MIIITIRFCCRISPFYFSSKRLLAWSRRKIVSRWRLVGSKSCICHDFELELQGTPHGLLKYNLRLMRRTFLSQKSFYYAWFHWKACKNKWQYFQAFSLACGPILQNVSRDLTEFPQKVLQQARPFFLHINLSESLHLPTVIKWSRK